MKNDKVGDCAAPIIQVITVFFEHLKCCLILFAGTLGNAQLPQPPYQCNKHTYATVNMQYNVGRKYQIQV